MKVDTFKAKIYRRAAKIVWENKPVFLGDGVTGCCGAISVGAGGLLGKGYANDFVDIFRPYGANRGYWGVMWKDDYDPVKTLCDDPAPEIKECRILALLFMAAMSEN